AGRARREPAVGADDLDAADRGVVAGCAAEDLLDRSAGEVGDAQFVRGEARELLLLRGRGGSLDTIGVRLAEIGDEFAIAFAGVAPGLRGDLGGEQGGRDAVLVGGPYRAVAAQETRARAFLAAETE